MRGATRALLILIVSLWPALTRNAAAQGGTMVTGVVQDQTGAVLPGASVQLRGATTHTATTDAAGTFRLEHIESGTYDLTASFDGFKPATTRLRVGTRAPASQKLVLAVAGMTQEVTVTNGTQVDTAAAGNLDAVSVDQNMLEALPVFDQDYVATISRFLDSGSLGTNGPTLVVNGMEVSALRVSASAIQQIKINQDPYSAEYSRPGRGRIEILTKPGGNEYHGEANVIGRDAIFDATNAFATRKPSERKTIVEGMIGGPLGDGQKTSFFISAHDRYDDQQAFVFAAGLSGPVESSISQPTRESLIAFGVTRQVSDATTISIRPNYEYEHNGNRGVGGTTLASAGTDFTHREEQVTLTHQTLISPTLVNQFQILVGHEREPTVSASLDPGIVVAGAFTGGGGQGDLLRTELHIQLTESLGWTKGRHNVRAGFQIPDWSRRGFDDRTNFGGTYYFSGLDTYAAGTPYALILQSGNGNLAFLEKQIGAYLKDDWQVRPDLSLSLGVRYDWQNYFHDNDNFSPRVSVAYAPGDGKKNVFRTGVGVFTDRSGPIAIADLLHYQPGGLVRYVISNPSYPTPAILPGAAADAPSIVQLAPGVQIPRTVQYSVGVDHQLRPQLTLSIVYTGSRGYNMFRSRDINAPLPPLYLARPNPAFSAVREIESDGRQTSNSVQVSLRGKMTKWFTGQTQYTWSRVYNDTNGISTYPANDYDLSGEWSRANFDQRHRMLLLGRITPGRIADFGVALTANSPSPYSETLGQDVYNNGRGRARPSGVPRNSLEGAAYASLDLRASRDVPLGSSSNEDRKLTFAVDAFNVLDRANYSGFVGTVGSPLFGQPISARPPRQLQFSARLRF